jgi:CheY-like chemotaxis protein
MNAIIGMTDLLMQGPLESEQRFHAVSIKDASMSLLGIINDILDFSKIDSQKMEIINETFDFASLIHDTVNLINIKVDSKNIAFITNISKDIPAAVSSDELRIKQALVNLLNNAVKFTKEGCVSLGAEAQKMADGSLRLHFTVKDTGSGIKKGDISKLFGQYNQVDTHENRHITGTGLGLSITRSIIGLMGGRISVESVYGKGSTFSFYVVCEDAREGPLAPLSEPERYKALVYEPNKYHAQSARAMFESLCVDFLAVDDASDFERQLLEQEYTHVFFDKSAEEAACRHIGKKGAEFILVKESGDVSSVTQPVKYINRPVFIASVVRILDGKDPSALNERSKEGVQLGAFKTKGVKVLLVDDKPVNLTVAEGLLKQYGIAAVTASGGREAIDLARSGDFDMIFMDHMMPDIDGIEATKAIRGLGGRFLNIPVIALSANAVSGAKDLFLEAGMDDFLSKPIIIGDLHRMLLKFIPPEKVQPFS